MFWVVFAIFMIFKGRSCDESRDNLISIFRKMNDTLLAMSVVMNVTLAQAFPFKKLMFFMCNNSMILTSSLKCIKALCRPIWGLFSSKYCSHDQMWKKIAFHVRKIVFHTCSHSPLINCMLCNILLLFMRFEPFFEYIASSGATTLNTKFDNHREEMMKRSW